MTTQPDTPSLLPCPHCGSPAELDTQQHYTYIKQGHTRMGSRIVVYCTVCPAEVGVAREEDECADRDEVIAAWNRRSPSEAARTTGEAAPSHPSPPGKMEEATQPQIDFAEMVHAERKKGNIVFQALPGQFMTVPVEKFVQQPVEGILYDLNRLEEVVLTFIDNSKWVNDYAVAQVIRELVRQRDAALSADSRQIREDARRQTIAECVNDIDEWVEASANVGAHREYINGLKVAASSLRLMLGAAIATQGEKKVEG